MSMYIFSDVVFGTEYTVVKKIITFPDFNELASINAHCIKPLCI